MRYNYRETIYCDELNKSKTIVADSKWELAAKKQLQYNQWNEQIDKIHQKQIRVSTDEAGVAQASNMSKQASDTYRQISDFLHDAVNSHPFDIGMIIDRRDLNLLKPKKSNFKNSLREPLRSDEIYNPKITVWDKIASKVDSIIADNDDRFEKDHSEWEFDVRKYKSQILRWEENKKKQAIYNEALVQCRNGLIDSNKDDIEKYILFMLKGIKYPVKYDTAFDVEYISETRTVIVDVALPVVEDMPTIKSASYIKTKQEVKESYYTDSERNKLYEHYVYQLILVIIKSIFDINDLNDLFDSVSINGYVNTIDKATGQEINPCILSIKVDWKSFINLNLNNLDPKAWFRKEKGISAANIAVVAPIAPIQTISRMDKRFVSGYEVMPSITEGDNIAAMDWLDFENLVRELFENEFKSFGGEVKITQASRDGGVDAVAFDPDPIRGGKIIIQAKRYTNVVGVAAVRDLYGTLINEGAMKGILVTTSYYGNDAYDFAKDKPIQLIDGGGLLSLMERQGQKARIDLKEAKEILKEV